MITIVAFLRARTTEDRELAATCIGINDLAAAANGAPIPRWIRAGAGIYSNDRRRIIRVRHTWGQEAAHITRWDPARVMAECAARQEVIAAHADVHECPGGPNLVSDPDLHDDTYGGPCRTLRLLAAIWAEHPDYDPEWTP